MRTEKINWKELILEWSIVITFAAIMCAIGNYMIYGSIIVPK